MDGREGMPLPGSASYYLHRGVVNESGSGSGSGTPIGFILPPAFRPSSNPNITVHSNVRHSPLVSAFQPQNQSPNIPPSIAARTVSSGSQSDPVKRKRGRPRKYGPGGTNVSLGLSALPSVSCPGAYTPFPKRARGRPRGTGWKQKLAPLGEWMNSSAGQAFTPHTIHIGAGEDIATVILSFAQNRPRALCIMSANGIVSAVTLRQPSGGNVTYEGRFEILCMSGSYLIADSGGPRNRTGGVSISLCSPDGNVIGGSVGGKLLAASHIQVVAFSFIYDAHKTKDSAESNPMDDQKSAIESIERSSAPTASTQKLYTMSPMDIWPPGSRLGQRNPNMEIDLTRG